MGGAVSSGRDNNELVDNLMDSRYIRTRPVERVFRALDRADYMTPEARDQAYKDQAWRNGPLHMSAPVIYSKVLEALELRPGLSFLNIGSGTGYFSTLAGLILGCSGINHGIEVHPYVVEYAIKKLGQFIENSPILDDFDFCEPTFYCGNGLCLAPLQAPYDRVYCGAGCPEEYQTYFKQLIKVGGVLVMPLNDNLLQVKRTAVDSWSTKSMINVSFATLRIPTKEDSAELIKLTEQCPARLQVLARGVVRAGMRAALLARHPALREPPPRAPQPANSCPRRICIPIEDDSDVEGLNALHDLDPVNGANEMNALLSLVLRMGSNRDSGSVRYDPLDAPSDSSGEEADQDQDEGGDNDDGDEGGDGGDRPVRPLRPRPRLERPPRVERALRIERPARAERPERPPRPGPGHPAPPPDDCAKPARSCRGLLTFEFQNDHKDLANMPQQDAPSTADDSTKTDTETKQSEPILVPTEVEIYLGKEMASTSRNMDWDEGTVVEQKPDTSSEEDTTETSKEQKRKKLDSGIGEGTTTSSGSSPAKSESIVCDEESDPEAGRSDNLSDDGDQDTIEGRRRRQKRGRCALGQSSSSSTECEGSAGDEDSSSSGRRRCKRRAAASARAADVLRPRRNGADARRVRLSIMMKRGVKELPLPYALKKYVNLGRCFEF